MEKNIVTIAKSRKKDHKKNSLISLSKTKTHNLTDATTID